MANQVSVVTQSPVVSIVNQSVTALSTDVAAYFEKRHDNVIRDIETLKAKTGNFATLNFEECYVNNNLANGKPQKLYRMTRDGFMLLVMGWTGEKALQFKIEWLKAFNAMEAELNGKAQTLTPLQQREVQLAVQKKSHNIQAGYRQVYALIKNQFHVGSYKQIPASKFQEVIDFVNDLRIVIPDGNGGFGKAYIFDEKEMKILVNLVYFHLLAKPTLEAIAKGLGALGSEFTAQLISLARDPYLHFTGIENRLKSYGFDVRQILKDKNIQQVTRI